MRRQPRQPLPYPLLRGLSDGSVWAWQSGDAEEGELLSQGAIRAYLEKDRTVQAALGISDEGWQARWEVLGAALYAMHACTHYMPCMHAHTICHACTVCHACMHYMWEVLGEDSGAALDEAAFEKLYINHVGGREGDVQATDPYIHTCMLCIQCSDDVGGSYGVR